MPAHPDPLPERAPGSPRERTAVRGTPERADGAAPLRVAVIGGLTRATSEWERAGASIGAIVEHHDGRASGSRAASLAAMASRADVIVSITIPNSHNAVAIARRVAATQHRVFVRVKRLRPSSLAALVSDALRSERREVAAPAR